jgi:hypothetical protein
MLSTMKVAELREVAENFGVEYEGLNKATLLATLAEEGVTEAVYAEFIAKTSDDVEEVSTPAPAVKRQSDASVLVFMNRANPTFEIRGHRFTKQHPYVAMSPEEAQEIFDYDPRGFRIATPNEVKEYYS